jgi:transcriptional regulator with PAS, ATPase and Fis domain
MRQVLVSWVGMHDLNASSKEELGALASIALESPIPFDEIHLLVSDWQDQIEEYTAWLTGILTERGSSPSLFVRKAEIPSPIDYLAIYSVVDQTLSDLCNSGSKVTINLTSGTPAMTAVSLLLGQGVYSTLFVQSSREAGRESVKLPFDISLAYLEEQDKRLKELASDQSLDACFEHIPATSEAMANTLVLAKKIAPRNIPVMIQGETGSGKEVMAQAIHKASSRRAKPFIAVNCGAIPETLISSELFGHKKGSFTGADQDRKGHFEMADGGTLFLDEVGELPLTAQVQLLRVLQEGQVTRVGESKSRPVDVRIIAATHRNLLQMVEDNLFREDLFYRLAVGVLTLPSLHERKEDIERFIEMFLEQINKEAESQPGYKSKTISQEGKKLITSRRWPGNIRELWNTLLRASIWSEGTEITVQDINASLIERTQKNTPIDVDVSGGVDINQILDETKSCLIKSALDTTNGQKKKAAKLLGLANHQTLTNWMEKLNIQE